MKPPAGEDYRCEPISCCKIGQQSGNVAQERTLIAAVMQRLEIFLKWCQQDGADDEGDQQSICAFDDVLPVAAPAQGEHAACTCNQEEQRYPPGIDQEQDGHNNLASFRVADVPV